jgi:hypothetical protein
VDKAYVSTAYGRRSTVGNADRAQV